MYWFGYMTALRRLVDFALKLRWLDTVGLIGNCLQYRNMKIALFPHTRFPVHLALRDGNVDIALY